MRRIGLESLGLFLALTLGGGFVTRCFGVSPWITGVVAGVVFVLVLYIWHPMSPSPKLPMREKTPHGNGE